MMLRLTIALPLLLASVANATKYLQFGNGGMPSCAKTCTLMNQASAACLTADETCFCQSGYLTTLWSQQSTPVCSDVCPSSAESQIKQWYTRQCAALAPPGAVVPPGSPTTVPSATPGSASGSPTPSLDIGQSDDNESWWSGHGRWIAMVIVLVIGFGVIIGVGIFLKKRHKRLQLQRAAGPSPRPESWGPRTSQHYGDEVEKGNVRDGFMDSGMVHELRKSSGGRLSKAFGR